MTSERARQTPVVLIVTRRDNYMIRMYVHTVQYMFKRCDFSKLRFQYVACVKKKSVRSVALQK